MGFQGPKTCPWLKIVTKFFFLGGATELKIWNLAPTLIVKQLSLTYIETTSLSQDLPAGDKLFPTDPVTS